MSEPKASGGDAGISRRRLLLHLAGAVCSLRGVAALAQPRGRPAVKWDPKYEVAIGFEINQAISRVHRPYLAVTIESPEGDPVRTVALWVNRDERYIGELRRWYRNEHERQRASGGDLLKTASSATRVAGVYTVTWDGRDDKGALVELGQYFVCIESARQNGTYQLLREPFAFAGKPFYAPVKGNYEIIGVSVEYRERKK
jgi:thiamine biosynthesis lipoprotein